MPSQQSVVALERAQRAVERYLRIRAHIRRSEHVIAMALEQMDRADALLRRSATTLRDLKRAVMERSEPPSTDRRTLGGRPAAFAQSRGAEELPRREPGPAERDIAPTTIR